MLQVEELTFYDDGSVYVSKAVHPEDDHIGIFPDSEHIKGVMQFTGLLDKSGKEVYEGDVVYFESSAIMGVVGFDKDTASFKVTINNYLYKNCIGTMTKYCEIKGNIHENPELL